MIISRRTHWEVSDKPLSRVNPIFEGIIENDQEANIFANFAHPLIGGGSFISFDVRYFSWREIPRD